jgi:hypothetical protein
MRLWEEEVEGEQSVAKQLSQSDEPLALPHPPTNTETPEGGMSDRSTTAGLWDVPPRPPTNTRAGGLYKR